MPIPLSDHALNLRFRGGLSLEFDCICFVFSVMLGRTLFIIFSLKFIFFVFYAKHLLWCSKTTGRLIRKSAWKHVALLYCALTGKMYEYLLPCTA